MWRERIVQSVLKMQSFKCEVQFLKKNVTYKVNKNIIIGIYKVDKYFMYLQIN